MKKIAMTIGIMVTSVFFLNAFVWEGIARTAPEDQFFEKGYTIATNSFPVSTVVEMTNLENGRTIQGTVISGLGPSGFLAMFSPDTAAAMGVRKHSPVKVRITQPWSANVPFHLPQANNPEQKPYASSSPASVPHSVFTPVPEPVPASTSKPAPASIPKPPAPEPTPESAPASASDIPAPIPRPAPEPVLIPPNFTGIPKPQEAAPPEDIPHEAPPDMVITAPRPEAGNPQVLSPDEASPPPPIPLAAAPPQNLPPRDPSQPQGITLAPAEEGNLQALSPGEAFPPPPVPLAVAPPQNPPLREPSQLHGMTLAPAEEGNPQVLSPGEESAPPPVPLAPAPPQNLPPLDPSQRYEMTLFPAEERPPAHAADFGTLPPEAEIAPVGPPPIAEAVPEGVPSGTSEFSRLPPPLETTAFGRASFDDPVFSVPVITSLEPGKYYLQLGAFGMIELAEAELARIGKKYPLAVQSDGNPYAPIYRILLGPVGLGESGALMQHFKSVGYNDAFVRQGL